MHRRQTTGCCATLTLGEGIGIWIFPVMHGFQQHILRSVVALQKNSGLRCGRPFQLALLIVCSEAFLTV